MAVRRRPWMTAAWATSPTFRVLLFLGGVLAVMTFLLYNEYIIQQFRDQERDRAELYAMMWGLALSEDLPQGPSGKIFEEIIINPEVSFPVIFTDHRDRILNWRGPGLPLAGDPAGVDRAALRRAMARMDAVNEPVSTSWSDEARARIYSSVGNLIVADPAGYAAAWSGPDLPAAQDTTEAARERVEGVLRTWQEQGVEPLTIVVAAREPHHLVHEGTRFAVARQRSAIAWGGPSLPAFHPSADAAAAQAFYDALAADRPPVAFEIHNENIIHFGDTDLISRISMAPFVTIGVLLLFILIGYVGSRNIRRSEQRSIWVGMAKETAHQLGTPLSSLSGWLELIRSRAQNLAATDKAAHGEAAESIDSLAREMQKDMGRLTQIASRFSQIGSIPELKSGDVNDVINETVSYFKGRGPQFGPHQFVLDLGRVPPVPLNEELMGWALENLFRNAMDAMVQQKGTIRVSTAVEEDGGGVRILVEDDGRGIEPEHLAQVFQPGFSTKKRGWGLGLAFVRRIVEEYHGGWIHIPRSEAGVGTTFEIRLPAADDVKEEH